MVGIEKARPDDKKVPGTFLVGAAAAAADKKSWLERECEELGITYLGQIKVRNGSMLD